MLLTITTTAEPATDLGYLLHKNPDRHQAFEVSAGVAHVFYPEATADRCTAALLLEVDPVGLVRGRDGGRAEDFALGQYVNDRPYAASSLLAVAISRVFRTAMAGRCQARPELAAAALPLRVRVPVLPCRGGPDLARRLFAPLGWQVSLNSIGLDEMFGAWGDSRYLDVCLTGQVRLADALNHLYVLLPVLDDSKHYWVSPDEVDKLIRAGGGWLAGHPDKELITRRYLAHRSRLFHAALARLAEVDDAEADSFDNSVAESPADDVPGPLIPLAELRRGAVLAVLRAAGARRVADLGCGDGALVAALLADPAFTEVIGADVAMRALEITARRLRGDAGGRSPEPTLRGDAGGRSPEPTLRGDAGGWRSGPAAQPDRVPDGQHPRLRLFQTALTYTDERLSGLDAVVLMEVIEHIDPARLPALERAVFASAAPALAVVTTPNAEHNVKFENLSPGAMRHRDHRFEWDRTEFGAWALRAAGQHGYQVRFLPVGDDDPQVGPPTQMAVFTRELGR